jgi:hypothetical protein
VTFGDFLIGSGLLVWWAVVMSLGVYGVVVVMLEIRKAWRGRNIF